MKVTTLSGGLPIETIFVVGEVRRDAAIKIVAAQHPVGTKIEYLGRASEKLLKALGVAPGKCRPRQRSAHGKTDKAAN